MKTILKEATVGGIKNPRLDLRGKTTKSETIFVIADGKRYEVVDSGVVNINYIIKQLEKDYEFDCFVNLPLNAKNIEIFVENKKETKILLKLNTSLLKRILLKIKMVFNKLLRIPKVIFKAIKILWQRYRFLIPPKELKRYILSFKRNINEPTIEEVYYIPEVQKDYLKWLEENEVDAEIKKLKYNPLISILIPVYNVDAKYLSECIDSILNQTYQNFEICIADDCSTKKETVDTLKEYEKKDKRVKVVYRKENGHISKASNSALEIATGDFVGLVDNDDLLHKDALYEVVCALNSDKTLDLIYTDEDKLHPNGKRFYPHFKSDFAPDTLLSSNYICHFTVLRKKIVEEIGGFKHKYVGAQDYDLFLRFTEKTNKIHHISKVLYHWRVIEGSTAMSADGKNYAYEAGKKALEDALKRRNIVGKVHLVGTPQMYYVEYKIKKEPLVSIIIPTKDRADMVKTCIDSIYKKTKYKNFEIILVDNNSTEKETFDLIKKYKKQYKNFKSLRLECEFNYSHINNEAVKKSKGDYVLLLNNDTKVITKNWLTIMMGYAMQDHIACVGAKLLFPNNSIQHCGVTLGVGGIAGHPFALRSITEYGYQGRLMAPFNYSAVTAACLLVKKSKFNEVDGLDENLKVAYNDVDFNMNLLKKGYYNVCLSQVLLYHYESISRGHDLDPDKKERFLSEIKYMTDKHGDFLFNDKFYNKNMSKNFNFVLERKEK